MYLNLNSAPLFTESKIIGDRDEQPLALVNTPYLRQNQRIIQNLNVIDGATELRMEVTF